MFYLSVALLGSKFNIFTLHLPFVSIIRHDDVSEGSNQFENNLRVKH